jgi:hypothetical protein
MEKYIRLFLIKFKKLIRFLLKYDKSCILINIYLRLNYNNNNNYSI